MIRSRRGGWKLKFLECDDDNLVAFIAQEKSRFGFDGRARNLAGVADLPLRPHQITRPQATITGQCRQLSNSTENILGTR